MFYVKHVLNEMLQPSALNKPWILSKEGDLVSIPTEVSKVLKNYQIMAIEFLYHNYRKGIKGSILNQEPDMNFPLQLSAFFRAIVGQPAIILVICSRRTTCFWHYHLTNHANFDVIQVTTKNSKNTYEGNEKKLALLLQCDFLKLCEDLLVHDFLSVVIEGFDQIAIKRLVKRLWGKFNVGLTYRSFYTHPDQKLQWNMLNWANPGCVGKLHEFYRIDNKNFERFNDNYRYWWMRLTWQFCESFERPTGDELEAYEQTIANWACDNSLSFEPKKTSRKRKKTDFNPTDEIISDSMSSDGTIINEVPIDKYVKLPSMDENPIVTSIIKNFEISPEPIVTRTYELYTPTHKSLPHTQTQPNCSSYDDENSVILSFLEDQDKPSTSKSESEDFIINLI